MTSAEGKAGPSRSAGVDFRGAQGVTFEGVGTP